MRLNFGRFVDWIFLAALGWVGSAGVGYLKDMSKDMASLNEKMATVITRQANQDSAIAENKAELRAHDERLRQLEKRVR